MALIEGVNWIVRRCDTCPANDPVFENFGKGILTAAALGGGAGGVLSVANWAERRGANPIFVRGTAGLLLGAVSGVYDTVRTADPNFDFTSAACVETNGADTRTVDTTQPGGVVPLSYLIRVENTCPGESVGKASDGSDRVVVSCP